MINGKMYDYESIKVSLPSGFILTLKAIKYTDKRPVKVHTGTGGAPIGYSQSKWEGDVELGLSREEFAVFNATATAFGGFYNMGKLDVAVTYGNFGEAPQVDKLFVVLENREFGGQDGDEELTVTLKGKQVQPAFINGVPTLTPLILP